MPRRRAATLHFNAIQLVGGLLPSSLIDQIARQDAPQMTPQDYGLPKGMRLQVPLDQAWIRSKVLWEEAKELRSRGVDAAVGVHFSQRLLKEVFGWGDLQACNPRQLGEASYPINFRAFRGTVPLVLTSLPTEGLDNGYKQFGQDSRRRSPHSCLQECLNADDDANWGVLCNGTTIRLLHDNPALVKPAYVAIALDQLFDGGLFDEFTVLWLLLQASRFQRDSEGRCVLDGWKEKGQQTGERALNKLRDGVQLALENLANGLLQHRANHAVIAQLESNELSTQAFFEELLRLVYRLLFLCVAEDRGLLFAESTDPEMQAIYRQGYSLSRLRDLAIRRSAYEGQHTDLWKVQRLVFAELDRSDCSDSPLGLPGLGGLFDKEKCSHLDSSEIANGFLLEAVKAIGWFFDEQSQSRTRINYRDLNTEEFGSVYESLLELHPQINRSGGIWRLVIGGGAGSDRKTTGSYYTPDALVQELIKSALLPVIRERLKNAITAEEKEAALLAIRVLDPACGSGHFLLAAARRLALELARIRAGDDQPSEELRQQCMREVVAKCIYGVDRNPMAVELCKVALWMEAIEPGKPLGFLDAHIQCGDSLVGVFDPKLLEHGIPDEAYKPLTGDVKEVCSSLKKDNQTFAKVGQGDLFSGIQVPFVTPSQEGFEAIEEDDLAGLRAKQQAYADWLDEPAVQRQRIAANTYTAAFFLKKDGATRSHVPTSEHLDALLRGGALPEAMELVVQKAATTFRFLHWHLTFPDAMAAGGFDCVLGNPPWDVAQVNEIEWFASRSLEISQARGATRKQLIRELEVDGSPLYQQFQVEKAGLRSQNAFCREARFKLSIAGKLNLYSLFLELALQLKNAYSRVGMIIPSGILYDKGNSSMVKYLALSELLISSIGYDNSKKIFPAVHPDTPFSIITLGDGTSSFAAWAYILETKQISDHQRCVIINNEIIPRVSPNTWSVPLPRSQRDLDLLLQLYAYSSIFSCPDSDSGWDSDFRQGIYNMSTSSSSFVPMETACEDPDFVRLFESKYFHIYNSRWATYSSASSSVVDTAWENLQINSTTSTQHYVRRDHLELKLNEWGWRHDYLIAWRDITNATNERTAIFALLPRAGLGNNAGLLLPGESCTPAQVLTLIANLNSLVFDYTCRQKVGGTHLNGFILEQLPVIPKEALSIQDIDFCSARVAKLSFQSFDMADAAREFDVSPRAIVEEQKSEYIAEIDAYLARLYGLNRDELRYILDPADVMGPDYPSETFRVLKNNEIRQFGEYRTQRLVLEAWDRLFGK